MPDDRKTKRELIAELADLRARVAALEETEARYVQLETELRESEERFRLVARCSNDFIYERDLRTGLAQFFGDFDRSLGYEPGEFPRHLAGWLESVHPEDAARILETIREQLDHDDPYAHEYRLRRKDGTYADWWDRGVIIRDAAGTPIRNVGAAMDVTQMRDAERDRVKLEAKIQQAQKLESLGILAGGIAHDFNNMLMAVLGNCDLALMAVSEVSPVRPMLDEISKVGHRAAELCKQMLAYSGKGRFIIKRIDLSELVEEMAKMLEFSISKKAILRYNLCSTLPAIEADASQIRQVAMNLIINASEAIGEKSGVISITTGQVRCDRRYLTETRFHGDPVEGDYAYLEVTDTGCGMDTATIEKIFDPFFTTKFTGRGLGLAAVLGIVRGHKGGLKVYSEPGVGTSFKVLFPIAADFAEPTTVNDEKNDWKGHGAVLLVDDEEPIRAVGRRMLERLGFEVLTCADGLQALRLFREHADKIRCVLLDLTMPNMDGEEACHELRRLNPNLRVIMSSGYDEQVVASRFAGKGLTAFIQKPYQVSNLSAVLKTVLPD